MSLEQPTPAPEQAPTTASPATQSQDANVPSTPPSITGSMDELGESLEEKNVADEATPLENE